MPTSFRPSRPNDERTEAENWLEDEKCRKNFFLMDNVNGLLLDGRKYSIATAPRMRLIWISMTFEFLSKFEFESPHDLYRHGPRHRNLTLFWRTTDGSQTYYLWGDRTQVLSIHGDRRKCIIWSTNCAGVRCYQIAILRNRTQSTRSKSAEKKTTSSNFIPNWFDARTIGQLHSHFDGWKSVIYTEELRYNILQTAKFIRYIRYIRGKFYCFVVNGKERIIRSIRLSNTTDFHISEFCTIIGPKWNSLLCWFLWYFKRFHHFIIFINVFIISLFSSDQANVTAAKTVHPANDKNLTNRGRKAINNNDNNDSWVSL